MIPTRASFAVAALVVLGACGSKDDPPKNDCLAAPDCEVTAALLEERENERQQDKAARRGDRRGNQRDQQRAEMERRSAQSQN